jgi:hypothetical protein
MWTTQADVRPAGFKPLGKIPAACAVNARSNPRGARPSRNAPQEVLVGLTSPRSRLSHLATVEWQTHYHVGDDGRGDLYPASSHYPYLNSETDSPV